MTVNRLKVLAFSHQGAVRPHNEDTISVGTWVAPKSMLAPEVSEHNLNKPVAVIVFDGMGGHNAGDVASDLAARELSTALANCYQSVGGRPRAITASDLSREIQCANVTVYNSSRTDPSLKGMGTTVAGLWFHPTFGYSFNVGDSRIYRFRDGFLRQLSVDHVGPTGGITQSLGGTTTLAGVEPHIDDEPIVAGWRYLICSDGLTDLVPFDVIETTLASSAEVAVRSLFDQAMRAGGHDNISLVLIDVEDSITVNEASVSGGENG